MIPLLIGAIVYLHHWGEFKRDLPPIWRIIALIYCLGLGTALIFPEPFGLKEI